MGGKVQSRRGDTQVKRHGLHEVDESSRERLFGQSQNHFSEISGRNVDAASSLDHSTAELGKSSPSNVHISGRNFLSNNQCARSRYDFTANRANFRLVVLAPQEVSASI